jgi:hypothetical protein
MFNNKKKIEKLEDKVESLTRSMASLKKALGYNFDFDVKNIGVFSAEVPSTSGMMPGAAVTLTKLNMLVSALDLEWVPTKIYNQHFLARKKND